VLWQMGGMCSCDSVVGNGRAVVTLLWEMDVQL
jgi:hypothetical protein